MSGALLGLDQGYGGPAPGTNPITVQQKIVYTAFPISGKSRAREKKPFYKGPADADRMRILRGEPTVMEKSRAPMGISAITRESQLFVFSCLNKWGKENTTKAQLVHKLTFGGFAGNDSEEGEGKDRRAFPVFFGGAFTIVYNGPDTIITGDILYWDLPDDDAESERIAKSWGHLKTRPVDNRATVLLRKYKPKEQGMTRQAIRATNSAKNSTEIEKLKEHARGNTDAYYKSHVDIVDCFKKIFLLGMAARDEVLDRDATVDSIRDVVTKNGDILDRGAKRLGLSFAGGVNATNIKVHTALLSMLMPVEGETLMYNPRRTRLEPTNSGAAYKAGEKLLKQIQGGGEDSNGLMETNVVEHLLAAQASGQYDITSRTVGRAISSAKTGGDLDIIEFVQ